MRFLFLFLIVPFMLNAQTGQSLVAVSQQLLLAVKTGEPTDSAINYLASVSFTQLKEQLSTDVKAKAFWLNIYNVYTQLLLQKDATAYKHRTKFFKNKQIVIAGKMLSLDFIEHQIIRRSEWKLGLGYIKLLFPSKLEKELRLAKKDYRIHFALNCGAKSCPPIAFYDDENLEQQLNIAEKSFVRADSKYNAETNTVQVSKIFSWFRGDFGGKKGIRKLLVKHGVVAADKKVKLNFKNYDWSLSLVSGRP